MSINELILSTPFKHCLLVVSSSVQYFRSPLDVASVSNLKTFKYSSNWHIIILTHNTQRKLSG